MDFFVFKMKSCGAYPCGTPISAQSSTGQNFLAMCAPQQAGGATFTQAICCTPPPPGPTILSPPSNLPPNPNSSPPPLPPPAGFVAVYINNPSITCEVQGGCILYVIGSSASGLNPTGNSRCTDVQGGVVIQVNFAAQADANGFYTMVGRE